MTMADLRSCHPTQSLILIQSLELHQLLEKLSNYRRWVECLSQCQQNIREEIESHTSKSMFDHLIIGQAKPKSCQTRRLCWPSGQVGHLLPSIHNEGMKQNARPEIALRLLLLQNRLTLRVMKGFDWHYSGFQRLGHRQLLEAMYWMTTIDRTFERLSGMCNDPRHLLV
eukprot:15548_5